MTNTVDTTELEQEVMDAWEDQGIYFTNQSMVTDDPYPIYEGGVYPWASETLGDVYAMLEVLGFESISKYINYKQQEYL